LLRGYYPAASPRCPVARPQRLSFRDPRRRANRLSATGRDGSPTRREGALRAPLALSALAQEQPSRPVVVESHVRHKACITRLLMVHPTDAALCFARVLQGDDMDCFCSFQQCPPARAEWTAKAMLANTESPRGTSCGTTRRTSRAAPVPNMRPAAGTTVHAADRRLFLPRSISQNLCTPRFPRILCCLAALR